MKRFFNPLGGIIVGSMLMVPYLFLDKTWDFAAYFISGTIPFLVLAQIICSRKKGNKDDNEAK